MDDWLCWNCGHEEKWHGENGNCFRVIRANEKSAVRCPCYEQDLCPQEIIDEHMKSLRVQKVVK